MEIGGRWVENNTTVKGRRIEEGSGGEELGPVEHKGGGKVGDHCANELAEKRKQERLTLSWVYAHLCTI